MRLHSHRYLCSGGCQAQCVPADTTGVTPSPPLPLTDIFCLDSTPATPCKPSATINQTCADIACPSMAGVLCGFYMCGSTGTCSPVCVKDPSSVKIMPPLPAPYNCPDGTPTYKCEPSADTTKTCSDISCDRKAGKICANFLCGNPATCGPVCLRDPFYTPPMPSPYICPDNKTQALSCSTGNDYWAKCGELGCQNVEGRVCGEFMCGENAPCTVMCLADPFYKPYICADGKTQARLCSSGKDFWPQCTTALDCLKEGLVCSEFQCGDSNAPCTAMCLKDPYYQPYLCPDGQPSPGCVPPTDQAPVCKPDCTDPGTFCVPLNCSGVCGYTCVKDPYYTPPLYICPPGAPLAGQLGKSCKPVDSTACMNKQCAEGTFCASLDCGAGSCSSYCVLDPLYYPPQPSAYVCPGPDNSTALACSSSKNIAADCAAMTCEDGTICGEFKCGPGTCKAMCVKDPYYRCCYSSAYMAKLGLERPCSSMDCVAVATATAMLSKKCSGCVGQAEKSSICANHVACVLLVYFVRAPRQTYHARFLCTAGMSERVSELT